MKFLTKIIFPSSFLLLYCYGQAQNISIATVGKLNIRADEFEQRYELSPMVLPGEFSDEDSLRNIVLYSLIAEKLWAMEAIDEGINTGERFKFYFEPIKKAIVRDKLFEIEIRNKVSVSDEDVIKGIKKYRMIPEVKILSFNDSIKALSSYEELVRFGSVDSLIRIDTTLISNLSTLQIKFGNLNEELIEDEIFNLVPRQFTKPLKNQYAWFIFQVDSIKSNLSEDTPENLTKDVGDLIRNRRIRNRYSEFYSEVFKGYTLKADEHLFTILSNNIYNVLISGRSGELAESDSQKIYLSESDINRIKESLTRDILDSTIFETRFGSITLNDFLGDLTLTDVEFPDLSTNTINIILSDKLRVIMQQETFYQLGVKRGFENSTDVQLQLALWKNNLLSQILKNGYNSKVRISEDELQKFYASEINDSSLITNYKYSIISSVKLEVIERILNLLNEGNDFDETGKNFANSDSVKFTITDEYSNPILNTIKSQLFSTGLMINSFYGPVKLDDGYSLVKIIDIEELNDSVKSNFEAMKEQIHSKLYFEKLDRLLESETVKLANKFGVNINETELKNLKLSDIKMFVHRYLGFGGRIAAMPTITPLYKWYYKWQSETTINP